jgi:beta-lactamase regulating signal transducer with metallopeptidase domain
MTAVACEFEMYTTVIGVSLKQVPYFRILFKQAQFVFTIIGFVKRAAKRIDGRRDDYSTWLATTLRDLRLYTLIKCRHAQTFSSLKTQVEM